MLVRTSAGSVFHKAEPMKWTHSGCVSLGDDGEFCGKVSALLGLRALPLQAGEHSREQCGVRISCAERNPNLAHRHSDLRADLQ